MQQRAGVDGEARFTMLETVREYALEQLEVSGEAEAIRVQHAAYYLVLAEVAEVELRGPEQVLWLRRLEAEHNNLRSALRWTLEQQHGTTAAQLVGALGRFWELHGYLEEGRRWLEQSLVQAGSLPPAVRAKTLQCSGRLATYQGDYAAAQSCYTESLALYRAAEHKQGIAISLNHLGRLARLQGDYAAAQRFIGESLALSRELGDTQGIAFSLVTLGLLARDHDDVAAAHSYYTESLRLNRELGHKVGIADTLHGLGLLAHDRGDDATAESYYTEALTLFRGWVTSKGRLLCWTPSQP